MHQKIKIMALVIVMIVSVGCIFSMSISSESEASEEEWTDLTADYLNDNTYSDSRYRIKGDLNLKVIGDNSGVLDLGGRDIQFSGEITLDLNGQTLKSSNPYQVIIASSGSLTIMDSSQDKSGKVLATNNNASTVVLSLTDTKIEAGQYSGAIRSVYMNTSSEGNLTINEGIFNGSRTIQVDKGNVIINGGTFKATEVGIYIFSKTLGGSNFSTPSVTINDGTIQGGDVGVLIRGDERGKASLTVNATDSDSSPSISGILGISGNGDSDGTSITINGGTITGTDTAIYHPQEGDLIVNGGIITGPNGIQYCGAGSITITNGEITGTGNFDTPTKPGNEIDGTINDGAALSIVSRGSGYQDDGAISVKISGGTFTSSYASPIQSYRFVKTSDDNGQIGDKTGIETYVASVIITGGSFQSQSPSKSAIEFDTLDINAYSISGGTFSSEVNSELLASGYEVNANGKVSISGSFKAVAKDSHNNQYGSLNDAIINASDEEIITLLGHIKEDVVIPRNKTVTINLDIYTLTNQTDHTIIVNEGSKLTITGSGTVDNVTHARGAVVNYGTFILESGKLTRSEEKGQSPTDNGGNSWYVVDNHGSMTVNYGEISATGYYSSLIRNIGVSVDVRASLTINGGTISNNFIAVKNDEYGDLIIAGGTITSKEQSVQNWGVAKISGGELTGNVASWSYNTVAVELTISDKAIIVGDVIMTVYGADKSAIGSSITPPSVKIEGGSINGDIITRYGESIPYTVLPESGDNEEYAWAEITGGKFTQDVDERFLAEGCVLTGSEGNYGVSKAYVVTVTVNAPNPTVTISASGITYNPELNGTYLLPNGTYTISVVADGYLEYTDTFTVNEADLTVPVTMTTEPEYTATAAIKVAVLNGETTLTVTHTTDMPGCTASYTWTKDGSFIGEEGNSIVVSESGTYAVTVILTADGRTITATDQTTVTFNTEPADPDEPATEFDITHSGQSLTETTVTTETIIITSSDDHTDIDMSFDFQTDDVKAKVEITGGVGGGNVTITVTTVSETSQEVIDQIIEDVKETVTDLQDDDVKSVDVSLGNVDLDWMIIKVPFEKSDKGYVYTAEAYFINETTGVYEQALSQVHGEEVWIYTQHNTPYVVLATSYSDQAITEADPRPVDPEPEGPDNPGIIPPTGDDDYVPLPPTIVVDDSSSDDDEMVKVAACAAAAVAAAIIALILVAEYRKR